MTDDDPDSRDRGDDEAAAPEPDGDAPAVELPRSPWLLSETRRSLISSVAAVVAAVACLMIASVHVDALAALPDSDLTSWGLLGLVVVWTFLATFHTALSWYGFRGLRGEDFARAVVADPSWIHRERLASSRLVRWTVGYGPSSWSGSVSALALVVVFAMILRPTLREIPLVLGLSLAMVAVSWLNVAVTYGLHYARVDVTDGGLQFPGEQPESLYDYMYLAVTVMTAFTTSDVAIGTRELRRLVLGQSLLAFVFNSVIIAMIISLLLGLA